jgi:ribosomal protein L19
MSNLIIEKLLAKTKRTDIPDFVPGDTVRVQVKIKEGDKERLQAFEGVVIAKNRGPQASFTVRRSASATASSASSLSLPKSWIKWMW